MKTTLTTDACLALLQSLQALDGSKKLPVVQRMDMALNIGRLRNIELATQRVQEGLRCKYSDPKPGAVPGTQVAPDKADKFIEDVQALGDKENKVDLEPLPRGPYLDEIPVLVLAGLLPILVDGDDNPAPAAKLNGHAEPANDAAPPA